MNDFTALHKTIIVGLFLASIVVLTALGFDPAILIGLFTMLLAGLGFTAVQQIKEQTNGQMHKQLDMLDKQSEMLAKMQPANETVSSPTPDPLPYSVGRPKDE